MSESLCTSCTSECCKDIRLELSLEEVEHLRKAGTNLLLVMSEYVEFAPDNPGKILVDGRRKKLHTILDNPENPGEFMRALSTLRHLIGLRPGDDLYEIDGSCGYISSQGCSAYDSRPSVCREFPMGSEACVRIRARAGISTPVELIARPSA